MKSLVIANEETHSRDLYIRAAVTMLYAHWEGFVKQIGGLYLEFVSRRKLKNDELSSHFLAISVSALVRKASASSKLQPCLDLVDFFRSQHGSRSNVRWKLGVPTKSNLKSEVFREIVAMLGLDYTLFATKEKLLDDRLLKNRNEIAHGQYSMVSYSEYLDLHDEVIGIMQTFYNQVDNSAYTEAYRQTPIGGGVQLPGDVP